MSRPRGCSLPRTEPVELTSGIQIASGTSDQQTALEHLEFIVTTVRDHLSRETCMHPNASRFCPECGIPIL